MIIIRFALPLIYSLIVGFSYSAFFKKKYIESIAPAFFLQMIAMLLTGMIFKSVSLGIYVFIIAAIVGYFIVLRDKDRRFFLINQLGVNNIDSGLLVFLVSYVLIYAINYGSHFSSWDEFSHWGVFIKETLRLDALYCTSPLDITHKDYVPVITLFEALWCKLSLRYSEADSYRGIQILQVVMLLPMICRFNDTIRSLANKTLRAFFYLVIVMAMPLYLTCQELFFYHTVYQDYIFGVMIFYSVYLIFTGLYDKSNYHCFVVALACTVLVMSKMVAMAFLPLLWLFYLLSNAVLRIRADRKNLLLKSAIVAVTPIALWFVFNKYVDLFVPNKGAGQSYDGLNLRTIIGIIFHDGSISYQSAVENLYIEAILKRPIIGQLGYVATTFVLIAGLLIFACTRRNKDNRKQIFLICIFNFCATVMYALMMYILYLTSFTEYEASYLASFTRYMSTPIIAILYTTLFCFIEYSEIVPERKALVMSIWVAAVVFIATCQGGSQIIPGILLGEQAKYESETEYVLKNVEDNESVYIINRGDNGIFATVMSYSCNPIRFAWSSPGAPVNDSNAYSIEYAPEELYSIIGTYDYLYFVNIDDDFISRYSSIFENADKLITGKMYKVSDDGTKIELMDCMDL